MNGWSVVSGALALCVATAALPAQPSAPDLNSAARELARKTAALAGRGEAVTVGWRDVSSLGSAGLAQARGAFEAGLRDAGGRISDAGPAAEAQITLSENQTEYLLVEEIRKGEDRQVWMAGWNRAAAPAGGAAVLVEARLIWEQQERILDVAVNGDSMLVLSGAAITRFARVGGQWQARERTALPARAWPRNLRGRLEWNGTVQAKLPGMTCSGGAEAVSCTAGEDPWALGLGRNRLLASFAAGRNYFDGRVVTASGARKTVPPFYSAAAVDGTWLLATVDGGVQIFDEALNAAGTVGAWGSDIAGTEMRCGGRPVVLATRPGDGSGPDAVRAYGIANRAAVPLGVPAELPGPVTALWPAPSGATAIVKVNGSGVYQAYAVTVTCGQ